eukprot:TRINITY_DN1377_c0_g1_i1.p1 TRINITY_DN1377_c0_g1~~TRINITY_DN1377_c0_g1_i1.p1  ORF type:complete len:1449 (+),score=544.42 TRINITY_DN1377_c0_g1_i1:47-4393(+)
MADPPAKRPRQACDTTDPFSDEKQRQWFEQQLADVREKLFECVPPWAELIQSGRAQEFFRLVTAVPLESVPPQRASSVLTVLIAAFHSLELEPLRDHFWRLTHFPLLTMLSPRRLEMELELCPDLRKSVAKIRRRVGRDPSYQELERMYFPRMVAFFMLHVAETEALLSAAPDSDAAAEHVSLCCRLLELMTDLICQMPTRRFFRAFVDDSHLYVHLSRSSLASAPEHAQRGRLFRDMLETFGFYLNFEVDDHTSEPLTVHDCETRHAARVTVLQRVAHKHFNAKLSELAMCSASSVEDLPQLVQMVRPLSLAELQKLCGHLCILDEGLSEDVELDRAFLLDVLKHRHSRRTSEVDRLNSMALYPDEKLLWNHSLVPSEVYTGAEPLALPKLNLQFLTVQDYLLRNFRLMRLESAYEVREDIEATLKRLQPRPDSESPGGVKLAGRCRMALRLSEFTVTKVGPPLIGFTRPSEVRAEIKISLANASPANVRAEWDSLRQHDVLILVGLRPSVSDHTDPDVRSRYGVSFVRGCEVMDVRDDDDNVFTGHGDSGVRLAGDNRTVRVRLDPSQYQQDAAEGLAVYESLTFVMRRRAKENNFKAVLETIRDLMTFPTVVPDWLHDLFLGYGDPDSAHHTKMGVTPDSVDLVDTLVDASHVEEAFPGRRVEWAEGCAGPPPYRVSMPAGSEAVVVTPYSVDSAYTPFPEDAAVRNSVRFTPKQVDAIRSASCPGLTMIVGPPGTGKTDVAVQIISNLHRSFPAEKTLVVTHSNSALNDIFEKTAQKDIDERYLLRLGMGEKELETDKDFSKWGRVNYMLGRRLKLLERVEKLALSIGVGVGFAHTCESSAHFFAHHVSMRWEKFKKTVAEPATRTAEYVRESFPFHNFFANTPRPLWGAPQDFDAAVATAEAGWRYLEQLFGEIEDCKAFELLRSSHDRGNYLLTKQAKVVAMTCTHAALKRRDFVRLGLRYDTLVMEESAQILEVETFIPMLLQQADENGASRLKRVVLIGDHNQLPPVVKNLSFQKYSHMDQSMFTRFVRLGAPTVQLDGQGRMRSKLADLFRWRYSDLKDLPHVKTNTEFRAANAGFAHTFQCIDVPPFRGQGETAPQAHFYQNLGEAEYVVATYMYMRLLGYPASKITILTTYNGQKHLIRDVINHRCGARTVFGHPPAVMTVDKFQGRQNDFVLLSLVRTDRVGHLRDPRRLVVALSRARLGLYVFCRVSLFRSVWELRPAFDLLLARPTALSLCSLKDGVPEWFPAMRGDEEAPAVTHNVSGAAELGELVRSMAREVARVEGDAFSRQHEADEARRKADLERRQKGRYEHAAAWGGPRDGWYFGDGEFGVGYYLDPRTVRPSASALAAPQVTAPVAPRFPRPPPPKRRRDVEADSDSDQDPERAPAASGDRIRAAAEIRAMQRERATASGKDRASKEAGQAASAAARAARAAAAAGQ